jgi:hypothetical protein
MCASDKDRPELLIVRAAASKLPDYNGGSALLKLGRNGGERADEAGADRIRRGNDHNRDTGGDETIFDRSSACLILEERHRGRGQQQIVVKHVTVNADQALVTDTVVAGKPQGVPTDIADKPISMLSEAIKLEPVGGTKKK